MDLKGSLGWQSTKLEFKRARRETAKQREALFPIANLTARNADKATADHIIRVVTYSLS